MPKPTSIPRVPCWRARLLQARVASVNETRQRTWDEQRREDDQDKSREETAMQCGKCNAAMEEEFVVDAREAAGEGIAFVAPDVFGGDDEDFAGLGWNVPRRVGEDAALHGGRVAAVGRLDAERGHRDFLPWHDQPLR